MSALLDTSVLVRYLTARAGGAGFGPGGGGPDPAGLGRIKVYGVHRAAAVDALIQLLQKENVDLLDLSKEAAIVALLFARPSGRVSFTDALIWAEAREKRLPVYTFDQRFPAGEVEVRVLF